MAADEGGQHLLDRRAVAWRVVGDALQRVDAAEADIKLRAAELVDRTSEPLGDLPLLSDPKLFAASSELPPGGIGAGEHGQAAEPLQQSGMGIVLELAAVVIEFDAPRWIADRPQLGR
jgi:hypothetical protein